MPMVNMKQSPGEESQEEDSILAEEPDYPYGLMLRLEDDELAKLGITEIPEMDEEFKIEAKAVVTSVEQRKHPNGEDYSCVTLQITEMDLEEEGMESSEVAQKLYGAND